MLERMIDMDNSWLLAINGAHAPWADAFFWQVSQPLTWLPLYLLLIVCLCIKFRGQRLIFAHSSIRPFAIVAVLLLFALAIGGADLICARLVKPLVARPRPTHDAEIGALIHLVNGYRGGAYGFCSNHAANTMAAATLFSLIFTYRRPAHTHLYVTLPMMFWVALNCYSRMYLGVHYPLDIVAGLGVGLLMALLAWLPVRRCLAPRADSEPPDDEG